MSTTTNMRLNQSYQWAGIDWTFWSLAPTFAAVPGFAYTPTKTSERRSCVWLYNAPLNAFLHAMVSPASPFVCAVKPGQTLPKVSV